MNLQKWLKNIGFEWNSGNDINAMPKEKCIGLLTSKKMLYEYFDTVIQDGYRLYDLNNGKDKKDVMYILNQKVGIEFDPMEEIYLDYDRWEKLRRVENVLKNRGMLPSHKLNSIISGQAYKWKDRKWLNELVKQYKYELG